MLAERQPKGGSKVNKYISAFIGGIIGTILGAIFAWFVVLDPNAPVYTFINSLPQSFQEPATNLFVFFGLIVCVCVGLYFTRLGYMSATKEGSAKLKIELFGDLADYRQFFHFARRRVDYAHNYHY